ncbi:MAG: GGDEF domain-containing protein [Rubrivivax sp.]
MVPPPDPPSGPAGFPSSVPPSLPAGGLAERTPGAPDPWRSAAPLWPALLAGRGQALAVKDASSGRYRAIGAGWQALFGLDPLACVGCTDAEIFGGAVASAWRAADQMALDRADAVASDHAFEWQGQWRELSVTRQGVQPEGEPGRQILSMWSDVRPQRQQARQLAEALSALQRAREAAEQLQAAPGEPGAGEDLRDPVSGLPGRLPFLEQLRREFDLSAREGREMSLVLLQVDEPAGGEGAWSPPGAVEVGREIGSWLRAGTRTMDATARLDDTRYAILLSGAGLSIAARRAEALRASRQPAPAATPGPEEGSAMADGAAAAPLTVSMGVASYPLSAASPEALLAAAEQALVRARARGGNQLALAGLSLGDAARG